MKRITILFVSIALWYHAPAQNITAVEYFFDADPGYGSGTSVTITPAASITNFNFDVSISSVSDGFHTLTVRAKDANNKWSHAFTRPFYKLPAAAIAAAPNITKLEYFFDADPGYGAGTNVSITAGTSINDLNVTASLSSVSDGFHTITFRSQDASGKWSPAFIRPFYKLPAAAIAAAPNITKLEYFYDADPGYGTGTNVTIIPGTSIIDLNVTADLSSVSDGFHTITFRTQDASNNWSPAFTKPFYKLPAAAIAAAPNITKLEYFFDADPGFGAGTNVTITPGTSIVGLDVTADLSSVTDGFHILTFRSQDANNNWSSAFTRPFYKLPAAAIAAAPNITRLEYFFDDDAGPGSSVAKNKSIPITPGTSVQLNDLLIDVSGLSVGNHQISFRSLDANGKWSIVHTEVFGVFGPPPSSQPTDLIFDNITTASLDVEFTASPDAAGYIAIRKAGSSPTSDPVDGTTYTEESDHGDGKIAYVGSATSFTDSGLAAGNQYYYKVYAYNGSGNLTNYLTVDPLSGSKSTLEDPVQIVSENHPATFVKGSNLTASVTVNSASKANGVILKYKGVSEPLSSIKAVVVTNTGNKFETVLPASELTDPIGMRYYFEVTDKNLSVIKSTESLAHVSYTSSSTEHFIPSNAGTKVSDYQIISVPLDLGFNNSISSVFSALGNYDPTQWRLYDYGTTNTGRDNREYLEGFSTIEPGKGYWLIKRNNITIIPGAGTAVNVDEENPFTISLVQGWNLIGNPYNFKISWTEVLAASNNPSGIKNTMQVFSGGSLTEINELDRYRGAFIESPGNVTLTIPTLRNKQLNGGRISHEETDLLKDAWELPISISNGELSNEIGGIGMHPKARLSGIDDFDRTSVPLLQGLNMPELSFSSIDRKTVLIRDVVPSQQNFTWQLAVNQSNDDTLKLKWPVIKNKGDRELILLDIATQRLIDMTNETQATLTTESKSLKIIFGDHKYVTSVLEKELPTMGQPYPNPAHAEVKIPFFVSESLSNSNVTIRIYNSLGKKVATVLDNHFQQGYHVLSWKPSEPAGLYLISMKVGSGEEKIAKLIIQ